MAVYACFATLWIYSSDRALSSLLDDPKLMVTWSVYKGIGFVLVTSVLLFFLVRRTYGRLEDSHSALKKHELEIERLQRLYAALSQINQAIVWTPERDALLRKVCEALVRHGGFRLAWIGWHDPKSQKLTPVASFGDQNGCLDGIAPGAGVADATPGATAAGLPQNQPSVCNNLLVDAGNRARPAETQKSGLRASAVFPIRLQGVSVATLCVYADQADFFQDKEVALLSEAAVDLSFALENFEREAERQRTQAAVERERLFSRMMIESMPGVVYFYNAKGQFLRWNRNFETVTGYSSHEIAAMHPRDFVASADRAQLEARIAEVFERGESSMEAPLLSKNGRQTPYYFTGRRVAFDGMQCLVGVGIDISERKQAEMALKKSEQRYRSTLESMIEGCQIIGFDWCYLYLNEAAAVQNRRPNAELLGRRMQDAWPGIDQTRVFQMLRHCMEERQPGHLETEFVFPDGGRGWFDVRVHPVPEGIFVLSIDISERHAAESALRELNENLEALVAGRTGELQRALVRAEESDRLKSAFLATMSHELRTPLNSIIGFTGILLKELAGPLNEEQTKQLGMVRGSARHLLELINDVLDLSKIEAGQLEIQPETIDLSALLEQVTATVKPLADKKGLSLHVESRQAPASITSDRRRLEQILLNLLHNAIKFTDSGRVALTAAGVADYQPEDGRAPVKAVCLQVADTGTGIKAEDLPRLFQPFHQLESGLTRRHDGTGLGLAICRRLAGLLGGTIRVESDVGRGSTFRLILPIDHPSPPRSAS